MSNMLLKTIIGMSSEAGGSGGITTTPHNLTSNDSDPRYTISQSSTLDIREAWMAMDGNIDPEGETESHTNQGYDEWWQITFNEGAVKVKSFTFTNRGGGYGYVNNPYYLQARIDETEWIDILEFELGSGGGESFTFDVNCEEKYQHWRILSPSYTYLIIGEIEFTYESNSGGSSGGNIIEADENCYVIEVQINETGESVSISDEGSYFGFSPTIDWGDGTLTEDDWSTTFEHYYNETGTYRIIWKNGFREGQNRFVNSTNNYITDVKQLSKNRSNYDELFAYCTISPTTIFLHIPPEITSIQYMFYFCNGEFAICIDTDPDVCNITNAAFFAAHSNITTAQLNCFSPSQYTDWSYAFERCQYLYEVWFSGPGNDEHTSFGLYGGNFECMFRYCNMLNINQTNFDKAFRYWENRILSEYGGEYLVREMFAHCYNLSVNVKADAFWNQSVFVNHGGCFYGCSSIQNYNDIPDDWK